MTEQIQGAEIDPNDEKSLPENILRGLILSYQDGWNKNNNKHEIKYYLTQTFHKVETKEGNKEVAYLRLERAIREKETTPVEVNEQGQSGFEPPQWTTQLVCTEMYPMQDVRMKLNPDASWRQQIYWNMIARLMQGGLEYAELLQRLQKAKMDEQLPDQPKKLDLEITNQLPAAPTEGDKDYKQWVENNNVYAKKGG